MLHLSLITLPRTTRQWRMLQPYELHQVLWKGFKGIPRETEKNQFLYRHQESGDTHSILVQSAARPDWTFLANEADGITADIKQTYPEAIPQGQSLRFLLRANPVTHRKYPDGKKRHIAIGSDREQLARIRGVDEDDIPPREELLIQWLERQGEKGGFAIQHGEGGRILCDVGPNMDLVFRKPGRQGKENKITLTTVDFSGVIEVTDSERFAQTLEHGIGRGKGFGCGLLSAMRI